MAKQVSAFKFVGALGNVVGFRAANGAASFREKAASVRNPQTEEQMDQRARFKLASQVSGMLGEVGKLALKANGDRTGARGKLNKMILESVSVENQVAKLANTLSLVKNPVPSPFANDITVAASASGGVVTGTITGLPVGTLSAKALLVYDTLSDKFVNVSSLDTSTTISTVLPAAAIGNIYFYAEIVVPTTAEGAARLRALNSSTPGFTLGVNRLDSANYAYTRTLNAGVKDGVAYTDSLVASPENIVASILNPMGVAMQGAINIGLNEAATADNMTVNEEFLALNFEYVNATTREVSYDDISIASGNLTTVSMGDADFTTPLQVQVPIEDGFIDANFNSENDTVNCVVYSKTAGAAVMSLREAMRTDEKVRVEVPAHWQGHYVEVYAFVSADPASTRAGQCSNTIYCGSGRIA